MADLRKCIGSTRFGIEAHEAPVVDFPVQPSQTDGFGRMCKVHWNQYTSALRKAAEAAKAAESEAPTAPANATVPEPVVTESRRAKAKQSSSIAADGESVIT